MRSQHPIRTARGFTLLELVLVIAIVGILGSVLLTKLGTTAEFAEKTSMEYTADTRNEALLFEFAHHIIDGSRRDIPALAVANPMSWLARKPANYLGELRDTPGKPEELGNWYYDLQSHELVYLVKRGDNFQTDSAGLKRVRYRVALEYDPALPKSPVGMVLVPVEPYKWF
jgi:prepilin-type N-terminal cleavage/methylation domain-containing protein